MKHHHAAALALVGWYLMLPPLQEDLDPSCKPGAEPTVQDRLTAVATKQDAHIVHHRRCDVEATNLRLDASLSVWKQGGEFDAASLCQAARGRYIGRPSPELNQRDRDVLIGLLREAWGAQAAEIADKELSAEAEKNNEVRCVATDDPRLKGK